MPTKRFFARPGGLSVGRRIVTPFNSDSAMVECPLAVEVRI